MKRLLIILLAASAAPALAQHAGHAMPAPPPPAETPADPHAGHDMPSAEPETSASEPHAGHTAPEHEPGIPDPPVAGPSATASSGPRNAADTIFDAGDMARAREQLRREHGAITAWKLLVDRAEARVRDGRDGYAWDAQAWVGGDIDRLWIKTEGEGSFGERPEAAEAQLLWSHALDPWFNLQAGVRYDLQPNPERGHLVIGVQGLAPYWFEVDGALFLSDKGELSARFEAEYDQRITQRLILQPRVEFDLAAQNVPERGIGSGLSKTEAGLRLRYEVVPEFAPYVGVDYERAFGDTAGFARAAGERVGGWSLVAGVRTWF